MSLSGCVYLVGAGCGKSDLITVRGLELIRNCDVIVYDDLIDTDLLRAVPSIAEKIYVGKRLGKHSASQPEICSLLIKKASEGKTVVRLKGGDPFVFGRGAEEILALREVGIPYEEVPGISSAIAIPAAAGIPVTRRFASRSVHIITAHTADSEDGLPPDMDIYAKMSGTLVFLMGLSKLRTIAARLMEAGKSGDTPTAVISGGNALQSCTVRASLGEIADSVEAKGIKAPAVIVVGEVAAMDLSATIDYPLHGVTVALTGTDTMSERLAALLKPLGAETFLAERSLVKKCEHCWNFNELCASKAVITFTSSNGVRLFFEEISSQHIDMRSFSECRFAVIGQATAFALHHYGIEADICPAIYTSEELAKELLQKTTADDKIVLFRSRLGSKELLKTLSRERKVQDIPIYDIVSDELVTEFARSRIEKADYIVFSSASGVNLFFEQFGEFPVRAQCVSIGEVTTKALEKHVNEVVASDKISADGIVDAILQAQKNRT